MSGNGEIKDSISFADVDTGSVCESVIAMYEGLVGVKLHPSDPVRQFLYGLAMILAQFNVLYDDANKQNFLYYARGAYLEHLGALLDVYRLDASPASVNIRFTIQEVQDFVVGIEKGTRVTADGQVFFATENYCQILAGDESVEVRAICTSAGVEGNGVVVGAINKIVDAIPYVNKVENLNISSGGSEREGDDSFRNRIRLASDRCNTAGSVEAYKYWALSASPAIKDVSVNTYKDEPGRVYIRVFLHNGVIPSLNDPILEEVRRVLNSSKIRPLTDKVIVTSCEVTEIYYEVQWWLTPEEATKYAEIAVKIEYAVCEYEKWQSDVLGRDIVPDKLVHLCMCAGAKRVKIKGLSFQVMHGDMAIVFSENPHKIIYGGVEEE